MSDKFEASGKHQLKFKTGGVMGGMDAGEGDQTVVACDFDYQPHCVDSHVSEKGTRVVCQNPVKWTTRGLKMEKDVPLDF